MLFPRPAARVDGASVVDGHVELAFAAPDAPDVYRFGPYNQAQQDGG